MLTLFKLLSYLPLRLLHGLGAGLGRFVWWLSPNVRSQFVANVSQAGVDSMEARKAIAHTGRMLAELPWMWFAARRRSVMPMVRWEGAEWFEQALAAGKGVIVATPHLGSWEMCCQALAERYGMAGQEMIALYRPARKAWLAPLVAQSRDRPGVKAVPTSTAGVRSLVRTLRAGGFTLVLPDQVPPEGQGVWAPWFGHPAYTMTLLPRLAQQTGAVVLLAWCERLSGSQGFVMRFEQLDNALLQAPNTDLAACAGVMNAGLERLVRRCPGQYLWSYKRYKQPRKDDAS